MYINWEWLLHLPSTRGCTWMMHDPNPNLTSLTVLARNKMLWLFGFNWEVYWTDQHKRKWWVWEKSVYPGQYGFCLCKWRWIGTLGGGDFFQVGLENSLYKKKMKTNLKQKTDSNCYFSNLSILVPYPNNFLIVCICILIFHGLYSPSPQTKFVSCSLGLGKFQISWRPSV